MMRSWKLLVGLSLGLAGCGSDPGGGGDDAPDGGVDALPGDTTAPQLVSSAPAADARQVSVLVTSLSVVLDEPLDPATVSDALSVTGGFYADPVTGAVTYDDATRTLTFVPQQPLSYGSRYAVRVSPTITDLAGNAFAGATIPFYTFVNGVSRDVSRATTGTPTGWSRFLLDASGWSTKDLYYNGAGEDQIWLTADDVVGGRFDLTYNTHGGSVDERSFNRGPDQKYDTVDDVVSSLTIRTYDSSVRRTGHTNYSAPGIDAVWGTADDVISSVIVYTWEGDDYLHRVSYNGPGDDGVWRTADDRVSTFTLRTHGPSGELLREVSYQPGPDLRAFTADDLVTSYTDNEYAAGHLTRTMIRTAGVDGLWLTADDSYFRWYEYVRDANGLMLDYKQIDAPGPDAIWLTSDDPVTARNLYTYDANKLPITVTGLTGAGPDQLWGTADDIVHSHVQTTYDAMGNRITSRRYGHPGLDGVWKTLDDRVAYEAEYDTAH